jgi:hypothetical protein
MRSRILLLLLSLLVTWSVSADAPQAPRAFNEVVEGRLRPQLEKFLVQLAKDGRAM